jgi:uncharacterized protein YbjT (DUF2867 family)
LKVIVVGATGMVGGGVLRECLLDPQVTEVLTLGRTATGRSSPKLREVVRGNLADLTPIEDQLRGYDACFWCLGVSSGRVDEAGYVRVMYDLPVGAAETLARIGPAMTFDFVSGAGTDSTEQSRVMWARVLGRTENALLRLPFRAAYMFRPAIIRPLHGARSKNRGVRWFYLLLGPFLFLAGAVAPNSITTTEKIGRAMIHSVRRGAPKRWLGTRDINELAK